MTERAPAPATAELAMKLTIAGDENPELYQALLAVHEPRRRTRRLKDLATKGLMLERGEGTSTLPSTRHEAPSAAVPSSGVTVADMLEWGEQN